MPSWVRILIIVAITSYVGSSPTRTAPFKSAQITTSRPIAYGLEVRLRRLHLVRPDLIPYPLEVEVFC
jgi:hypothetical protein